MENGKRRQFSAEAYLGYGTPPVSINETGTCHTVFSCPDGEPIIDPPVAGVRRGQWRLWQQLAQGGVGRGKGPSSPALGCLRLPLPNS